MHPLQVLMKELDEGLLWDLLEPKEEKNWNAILIDYEKPHVERLWRHIGDNRLYLHTIHPCKAEESFFHFHPWPSIVRIVEGHYRMWMGFGHHNVLAPPEERIPLILTAGSEYEMLNPRHCHSVEPLDQPSRSIMVTAPPWNIIEQSKPSKPPSTLSPELKHELFAKQWLRPV